MQCHYFTTMFRRRRGIKKCKHPSFPILKRNLKSLQLIQRRQMMIQSTLTNHSQGIHLISNTYILIFYYRINVYIYQCIWYLYLKYINILCYFTKESQFLYTWNAFHWNTQFVFHLHRFNIRRYLQKPNPSVKQGSTVHITIGLFLKILYWNKNVHLHTIWPGQELTDYTHKKNGQLMWDIQSIWCPSRFLGHELLKLIMVGRWWPFWEPAQM